MKSSKNKVEEFIRVDHAGERGAVKIYEGQLLALNTLIKDESLKKTIEEMKIHEKDTVNILKRIIEKDKPTNFTLVGFVGCWTWFWFNSSWKKSSNALHCFCRGSYR